MEPIDFKQSNGTLAGGPAEKFGTDEEVVGLAVYRGGGEIISCWKPSLMERMGLLLGRPVWLRVLADSTHSPVSLSAKNCWQ